MFRKSNLIAYLGFWLAVFGFNIQIQAQVSTRLLYATDNALCPLGASYINVDANVTQLIFGITQGNFLGPDAFKSTRQVCFDLQTAHNIMKKYNLVPPEVSVKDLTTIKVLKFVGADNSAPSLHKFVLGCELLKHFDQGILAFTSTDLREANCKYLRKIAPACAEFFGDHRFDQGSDSYQELLVCSIGGSSVSPDNPLSSGVGPMCAHSDGLCNVHETYVNMKDSPYIFGIDFINTPFTNQTFDTLNQVCFNLNVAKSIVQKYKIIVPEADIAQLTQNSPELQKFLFGCEFLKRNPTIIAPWDLVVRDTVCEYEKLIAPACAELYCNQEFVAVADSITCHKRGIGQINPRGRPYPAVQPVGLAAQVLGVQPQWHAAAPELKAAK